MGPSPHTPPFALILVLGHMGLRSEEARSLEVASIKTKRVDGRRPWLRVAGKGAKLRELPIPTEVCDALPWERARPTRKVGYLTFDSGADPPTRRHDS